MLLEMLHAPVRGAVGVSVGAEVEVHPAVLPAVDVVVLLLNLRERILQSLVKGFLGYDGVVARDVVVALEIGGNGEVDGRLVGIFDLQHTVAACHRAAFGLCRGAPGELHLALETLVPSADAAEHNLLALRLYRHVLLRRCHVGVAGYHSLAAGGEVYHYHVSAERRDVFALVIHSFGGVCRHHSRRVETQLAAVVGVAARAGEAHV